MPISITNFFLNEKKVSILYSITLSVLNFKFGSKSSTNELVYSDRPFVFVSPYCPKPSTEAVGTVPCLKLPKLKLKPASSCFTPTKEFIFRSFLKNQDVSDVKKNWRRCFTRP